MSGPAFFTTRIGQRFLEVTVPKIADQLERLNTTLEAIAGALQGLNTRPTSARGSCGPAADPVADWEAPLAQIAREQLQIDDLDPRGADASDFREIAVSALGVALRAAYRAGAAASLRQLRAAAPVGTQPGAHEPR